MFLGMGGGESLYAVEALSVDFKDVKLDREDTVLNGCCQNAAQPVVCMRSRGMAADRGR